MGIELKITKGPKKGKIVVLKQKSDNSKEVLVKPVDGGPAFLVNVSDVKRFNLDKKNMKSLDNQDFMFETKNESNIYIEDDPDSIYFGNTSNKNIIDSEIFDSVELKSKVIESIPKESIEYNVGYDNYNQIQLTDIKNLGLTNFETKIFSILYDFYKIMYSGNINTNNIGIFAKNISGIIESELLIKVSEYRLFISILLFEFIKRGDLKYPDNIDKKLNLKEFIEFLLQSQKKIIETKIKLFEKIILKNFFEKKNETKKEEKIDKIVTKKNLIDSVNKNKDLTEKTKEILIKSINLFDKKDFSKSLNPLVKKLYKDFQDI